MTYETIGEYNITDVQGIFTYTGAIVPIFYPLLLFAIFIIILMSSYLSQKRNNGSGDFLSSLTVASIITTINAFIFSMLNLVNKFTFGVCITITIISVILLFLNDKE